MIERKILHCLLISVPLFYALSFGVTHAQGMKGPFPQKNRSGSTEVYPVSTGKVVLGGLVNFYSKVLSPADGPRSPSYPTGSAYGREAIQKHGVILGVLLTADRLVHEVDHHQGTTILIYGVKRYFDPVRNNTFWWNFPEQSQVEKK